MCSCQKKYSNEPFLGNLSSAAAAAAKTDFFQVKKMDCLVLTISISLVFKTIALSRP